MNYRLKDDYKIEVFNFSLEFAKWYHEQINKK